ncbi:MAG: 2-oxoacid:ferredoxin oxidoreductase subunit beta [Bdellovibrionales bacterium]
MSEQLSKPTLNAAGFSKSEYEGAKSTLCMGCGHDSVTQHILNACFQSSVNPYTMVKMSGIGCSSKTPAYFLGRSHGFNSLHGRMAPVATGARLANRTLLTLGVSGDGDTASIGLGGFAHLVRRNLPMVYIVENNGVYGLTKGQFSATADKGSTQKSGDVNPLAAIDICSLAIDLGASFVARSFSGDAKQLVPLISAALRHPGTAVLDVVSPCVAFANHDGSTKSYDHVREKQVRLQELGFIQPQAPINVDYAEGTCQEIRLHDGSRLTLKKLDSRDHDLSNGLSALKLLHDACGKGEILTGLFLHRPDVPTYEQSLNLTETPLAHLCEKDLRPTAVQLKTALAEFK